MKNKRGQMKRLIGVQSMKSLLSVRVMKIALTMVVFVSMIINTFVPRSIENKEQIMSVVSAVFSNVIVNSIKECTDTLTVMSNKITKNLYKLLMLGEVGTDVPVKKGDNKEETPVNTSSDSGIEIESREYKELVSYSEKDAVVVITAGKIEEKLYRLYGNIKVYCSQIEYVGMLFFIMFIVVIRNRKEEIARIIKDIEKNKTNLC